MVTLMVVWSHLWLCGRVVAYVVNFVVNFNINWEIHKRINRIFMDFNQIQLFTCFYGLWPLFILLSLTISADVVGLVYATRMVHHWSCATYIASEPTTFCGCNHLWSMVRTSISPIKTTYGKSYLVISTSLHDSII